MRKIDWEAPLSEDDIAWLRASGQLGMEDRIRDHQAQFDAEVPEVEDKNDALTQSALDPEGRAGGVPVPSDGAPINLTPEPGSVQAGDAVIEAEDVDEPYEKWPVADLEDEVAARNELAEKRDDIEPVQVEGTGRGGKAVKSDLVKALTLWDQLHPEALKG